MYGLSMGLLYSLGAMFPIIMDTFNSTRAETSIIQSIFGSGLLGGGIIWGIIVGKFGPQKTTMVGSLVTSVAMVVSFWTTSLQYLIITSIFAACGLGMCFVSCTVGVRKFFVGKSSKIALALISSSSGSTGVVFTYLFRYLSDMYGLRGMLLIIGGLELHGAVLSLLWKQNYATRNRLPSYDTGCNESTTNAESMANKYEDKKYDQISYVNNGFISSNGQNREGINCNSTRESIDKNLADTRHYNTDHKLKNKLSLKAKIMHLLNDRSFIFTGIALAFCINSLHQYVVFLLDMYKDWGYSRLQGSNGLAILNIAAIVGRASPAIIAKCKFYNTFMLPVSSNALASIASFLLTVVNNIVFYNILAGCIGFAFGVCVSVLIVTVSELVEPQYLPEAIGVFMTMNGVCSLFRSVITGYLRDLTGSYTLSQILASVFTALGSVIFIAAAWFQSRKTKNPEKKNRSSICYVTKL